MAIFCNEQIASINPSRNWVSNSHSFINFAMRRRKNWHPKYIWNKILVFRNYKVDIHPKFTFTNICTSIYMMVFPSENACIRSIKQKKVGVGDPYISRVQSRAHVLLLSHFCCTYICIYICLQFGRENEIDRFKFV